MDSTETVPAVELRLSISDTEPLIWRQLVLPESATVAEQHGAIQCAFGWKNSHLYAVAGHDWSGTKRIFMDVDDGDGPEGAEDPAAVRLMELFDAQKPGVSDLLYEYDFGDSWTHDIEVVGPAELHENTIACLDGAMRGPIEDSGGVGGYANVVAVVSNPKHPEHREAAEWLEYVTQEPISKFDPTAFDLVAINGQLRSLAQRFWPGEVTVADYEDVLGPILWLLQEAQHDGLPLTSAGYLKPAFVKRAMTELGWDDEWMSAGRVEVSTLPIRNLREQLQEWKLLRKLKDRLLLTPRGRKLAGDPEALWDFLADQFANPGSDAERMATPLFVHWELTGDEPPYGLRDQVIQAALHQGNLRTRTGGEIPLSWASDLYYEVTRNLHRLELWERPGWVRVNEKLSDAGVKFLLEVQSRMD
ncbi:MULTISPECIES: plasmid pRiA4b ORF-3 family protein [unclassified Arthrobacter]|uniref:plasmid pRiA4b ORF-3 family protein n=1 Tax=unclassified Arthrobacter TaxID=235627 RepID=UPI0028832B49|nr:MULTISPECIES: plasmid pRiA4b ORF-3 family protein [unclassified Arthrobacter]